MDCCACGCDKRIRISSRKDDLEIFGESNLKDDELDILVYDEKGSKSIVIKKDILRRYL